MEGRGAPQQGQAGYVEAVGGQQGLSHVVQPMSRCVPEILAVVLAP